MSGNTLDDFLKCLGLHSRPSYVSTGESEEQPYKTKEKHQKGIYVITFLCKVNIEIVYTRFDRKIRYKIKIKWSRPMCCSGKNYYGKVLQTLKRKILQCYKGSDF
jgi:hypothetical protein